MRPGKMSKVRRAASRGTDVVFQERRMAASSKIWLSAGDKPASSSNGCSPCKSSVSLTAPSSRGAVGHRTMEALHVTSTWDVSRYVAPRPNYVKWRRSHACPRCPNCVIISASVEANPCRSLAGVRRKTTGLRAPLAICLLLSVRTKSLMRLTSRSSPSPSSRPTESAP